MQHVLVKFKIKEIWKFISMLNMLKRDCQPTSFSELQAGFFAQ